jgi:hypothetical protein
VPIEWYDGAHGWPERNRIYLASALELLEAATGRVLGLTDRHKEDIDSIVVVSTTGIATPSLDAMLIERMGLRRTVRRLPIFGLGCAGGVLGFARAADQAAFTPGAVLRASRRRQRGRERRRLHPTGVIPPAPRCRLARGHNRRRQECRSAKNSFL